MNCLFLDIDGVLKSFRSCIAYKECENAFSKSLIGSEIYPIEFKKESFNLDEVCLQYLKNIVLKYNFKIVISSSWRYKSTPSHFIEMFKLYDWNISKILLGFTPICTNGYRGEEIKLWFQHNKNLNIEKYIILDDNKDFCDDQLDHLILTDPDIGLNYKDIEKIENIMEKI